MRKIRKRCACGCGGITNYGKQYIRGHNKRGKKHTAKTKAKMSLAKQNISDETKLKISIANKGKKPMLGHKHTAETKAKMSETHQNRSDETKLNMSLARIKYDPDNPYCDVWKSREYKKDIRKDYCENADCEKICKILHNHHIYLDKKKCAPIDIMTLCMSCHMILHAKLQRTRNKTADPKDYIIINRPDHVSYIHKKTHKIIARIRKII